MTRGGRVCSPLALLVGALGAGVVLVERGAPWPPALPSVALVVVLALAVNRGAFFSTELVATSEAAVLFAAVVGFRHDAALLGPLLVALAVGPLDTVHWRQRAFVRMAYNSGSQGLAVLLGAVVFREITERVGGSFAAVVGAAACAAVPYALADSACGVALMRTRHDTSLRDAVRHQWSLNGLALPLACVGAVAGFLALEVGWWLTVLVLLPLPWIPELVLVRARRVQAAAPRTQVRLLAGATLAAGGRRRDRDRRIVGHVVVGCVVLDGVARARGGARRGAPGERGARGTADGGGGGCGIGGRRRRRRRHDGSARRCDGDRDRVGARARDGGDTGAGRDRWRGRRWRVVRCGTRRRAGRDALVSPRS